MPAACSGGDAPLEGLVAAMTVNERTELRQWTAERSLVSGINERAGEGKEWKRSAFIKNGGIA